MSAITPDLRSIEADQGYEQFEHLVKERLESHKGPLFIVDTADRLWGAYLSAIPAENRQHYNCHCCKQFVENYGGLVTITENGHMESAVWPHDVPEFFQSAVTAMRKEVMRGRVTGVFLSDMKDFGTQLSPKGWTHLHAENPSVFKDKLLTAFQRSAELKEDYGLVQRTIAEYDLVTVQNAVTILNTGIMAGEEKGKRIAEWYLNILQLLQNVKNRKEREGIVWVAVASAPPGFSHLKNGMVGTLLNDLVSGKDFAEVKSSWEAKMKPTRYRRPTAPVSDNQIAEAEKLVEKLGIARSLQRRFATADELQHVLWTNLPIAEEINQGGVFDSIRKTVKQAVINIPNRNVSWAVFQRDVLPTMTSLEVDLPRQGMFIAMTSAIHMDAPPILQWDHDDRRNPVSFYTYPQSTSVIQWRVVPGWTKVDRITWPPHGPQNFDHHMKFLFFNIEAMMDINGNRAGMGLFPTTLKSELRQVEKVVEKFSNTNHLQGTGNANGYAFAGKTPVHLRVNGHAEYTLDRWE